MTEPFSNHGRLAASYQSNSWRQQQFRGGHDSEVCNVDQHVADRYQRDPYEDGQWQVPERRELSDMLHQPFITTITTSYFKYK